MTNKKLNYFETRLNELQATVFKSGATKKIKEEWNSIRDNLRSNGYNIKKTRVKNNVIWHVVLANSNTRYDGYAKWKYVDVSPKHKHLKGNCTTRVMTYALNGSMTYDEIEKEQYHLAKLHNTYRNSIGTWDEIMTKLGWHWITLAHQIRRDKLAKILKNIPSAIISRSSGHVAIIHNGEVVDSWDSRGGKVKSILVDSTDIPVIVNTLVEFNLLHDA